MTSSFEEYVKIIKISMVNFNVTIFIFLKIYLSIYLYLSQNVLCSKNDKILTEIYFFLQYEKLIITSTEPYVL